jgi:putative DNA primase/helicase
MDMPIGPATSGVNGGKAQKSSRARPRTRAPAADVGNPDTRHNASPALPESSQSQLAMRFVEQHACELRYCAGLGRWLMWDGSRWHIEPTYWAFDLAHALCREAARAFDRKEAVAVASAGTVAGVIQLARADRKIAATVEQWDADPWSITTPGGTVDLTTGELHASHPETYSTKCTAVTPEPLSSCPIPTWLRFLDRTFAGDVQLIAYVQRMLGYALTGSTREHALFFGYGTGANGKSVLISTVAGILGDYHRASPIETFTTSGGDRHPTELAALRGARLVTATETEEGRRWAESRLKALTGGDTISARFMRQDFFDFKPAFKLLVAGNHKPGLRAVDEAVRRRFNLIPFRVTIPKAERDGTLTERLQAEWPGILTWIIEGCLLWQERGLSPPAAVLEATDAYLDAEDEMGAWLRECCIENPLASAPVKALYASWREWIEADGMKAPSCKAFSQALEARRFERCRSGKARLFKGLTLGAVAPRDTS